MCLLLGGIASCSASDSAYSYTFLRSVVCDCVSVVCHIRAPCLNCSSDLDAIWQVHLRGPMTHCVIDGVPDFAGNGEIWGLNPSQTCYCKLLQPPVENERLAILPFAKLRWFLLLLLGSCKKCNRSKSRATPHYMTNVRRIDMTMLHVTSHLTTSI